MTKRKQPSGPKDEVLYVRVDAETKAEVVRRAKEADLSQEQWVRARLREALSEVAR